MKFVAIPDCPEIRPHGVADSAWLSPKQQARVRLPLGMPLHALVTRSSVLLGKEVAQAQLLPGAPDFHAEVAELADAHGPNPCFIGGANPPLGTM